MNFETASTQAQTAVFKDIFLKLFFEHSRPSRWGAAVEAAWLKLLLVEVQRWIETQGDRSAPTPTPPVSANPDLLRLRHSFRSVFGCSPWQLLLNLRMQQAKNLLLETPLLIKEVAAQVGYPQQDELTRTFRRLIDVSPSAWREQSNVAPDPMPAARRQRED